MIHLDIRDHQFKMPAFVKGEGSNICQICQRMGVGVKNRDDLPTSSMDGL